MSDDSNNTKIKMQISFAPGCFDGFEGTQEELDELVAEIQRRVEDGSLLQNAVAFQEINPELMRYVENLTDEEVSAMVEALDQMEQYPEINHTLH